MIPSNRIRYIHFMSGVLARQADDPLCSVCKAFTNSLRSVRESLDELRDPACADDLDDASIRLLESSRLLLDGLTALPDAVGQKKAGNCGMPEGVCFVKTPKSMIERL